METKDLQHKMMMRAIELARESGRMDNGNPFGAVITKGEEIIAESRDEVLGKGDCTQHAELRAIQRACRKLQNLNLHGCVLYSSCEPCLMCLGAAYWSGIDYIYFGASAEDALEYGFSYSYLYQSTNRFDRHKEFKMIQVCREEAIEVLREQQKEYIES